MRTDWRDGERSRAVTLAPLGGGRYRVTVDDADLDVEVRPLGGDRLALVTSSGVTLAEITVAGPRRFVRLGTLDFVLERDAGGRRGGSAGHSGGLEAPMPGTVTRVLVEPGDAVRKGQALVAIEAMKMEHLIRAPRDGVVRTIAARTGEMVDGGVALVEME